MVLLTKLGAPGEKRSGESGFIFVLAYVASSVIASLAGFGQLSRVGLASPSIGTGYETLIIFVFACALLSRALDNRYVPVLFAMLPAMFWVLLNNVLILLNISPLIQISLNAALALLFLVIAYTAQSDALKATFGFKKRP
jgi:ribose/xylose/arabinose/galactoside ABC-type transport system permease subunit